MRLEVLGKIAVGFEICYSGAVVLLEHNAEYHVAAVRQECYGLADLKETPKIRKLYEKKIKPKNAA